MVTAVDPRGPASGVLEEGDVLLALDGRPVNAARIKGRGATAAGRARHADHPARSRSLRAPALASALSDELPHAVEVPPNRGRWRRRARCCWSWRPPPGRCRSTAGRRWRRSATPAGCPRRGARRRRSPRVTRRRLRCWRRRRCRSPRSRALPVGRGPSTCTGHVRRWQAAEAARRCGASRPPSPPMASAAGRAGE